jgi:hypothetical protein
MLRRLLTIAASSAVVVTLLVGCGSSSSPTASPAPSSAAVPGASAPAPSDAAATDVPSAEPASAAPDAAATMVATCGGVGVRRTPSSKGSLIVRLPAGAKVRIVQTVTGDSYNAGSCGQNGNTWYKVDQVNDKSMKARYGAPFGFVAAGFFQ